MNDGHLFVARLRVMAKIQSRKKSRRLYALFNYNTCTLEAQLSCGTLLDVNTKKMNC